MHGAELLNLLRYLLFLKQMYTNSLIKQYNKATKVKAIPLTTFIFCIYILLLEQIFFF